MEGSISVHLFPMSVDSKDKHHAEGSVEGGSQARGDLDCASIGASSVEVFRNILQKPLRKLVGEGIDAKPRGFENAWKKIGWGGGSCYISSALQLVFASRRVQLLLAQIAEENVAGHLADYRQRNGTDLWQVCTQWSWAEVQRWTRDWRSKHRRRRQRDCNE